VNLNNRFFAVLVLTLATIPGWGADTVVDQLYGLRNYDLADAYWAAGQRFTDLGQTERGAQFQAQAKRLFPGYVPGQAPAFKAMPVAQPATTPQKVPETSVVREKNLQGEKIARLQFQKLLRGYLTGSAATVAAVLGTSVEIQGTVTTPTPESVAAFLEAHSASAGAPEDLLRIDTLEVVEGPDQQVVLKVTANPEADATLPDVLPFWKAHQTYTFDRFADSWKLVKIEGN